MQNVYMDTAESLYRYCRTFIWVLQNVYTDTEKTSVFTLHIVDMDTVDR